MKKKSKQKAKSNSSQIDRAAAKFLTNLRIKGDSYSEIYRFKILNSPETIFKLFPKVFAERALLESIHGEAFPKEFSSLFSKKALDYAAHPLNEIMWAICRLLQFGSELKQFNEIRESFERNFLLNNKTECETLLNNTQSIFGFSIWLIQSRLAASQHWSGIEETRKLLKTYEDSAANNYLLLTLLKFIGKRIEATGLREHLKSELSIVIEGVPPPISTYLTTKLFDLPVIRISNVPSTMLIESTSCVIDYYETLINVLQAAASDRLIPPDVAEIFEKPLYLLYKKTSDKRLLGVLRSIGVHVDTVNLIDPERAAIIESYTLGKYRDVINTASIYLEDKPEDLSILILSLRSAINLNENLTINITGVFEEIIGNFIKIIRLSEDTYSAAYELLMISDRFYGQSWVHFMNALLMYEIRSEHGKNPPLWLNDVYVRDTHLSPFSIISATGKAKEGLLRDASLKKSFQSTWSLFQAYLNGNNNNQFNIIESRFNKYLAFFHLDKGDFEKAILLFDEILKKSTGTERFRCSAGASLAHLRNGNIERAIEILVRAFVEKEHIANILPVKVLIESLEDPLKWPNSICVPLLFEIANSDFQIDCLSSLRYSFEKFQLQNNINSPSDLLSLFNEKDIPLAIAYMKRVWRPEVMRQTLIYQYTKEIEDARIKVCRYLSEIDISNANNYLEEIKERVKKQEISKGTTLIAQSKVYVDIEAIKKSLKIKLGDSYARYKSSSQSLSVGEKPLVYKIADVISQSASSSASLPVILSAIHLLDDKEISESDVQFQALFSEVTNEFLKGNHGLNAYLSTTVRHGTLRNTLRKPVEDEKLVTSIEEDGAYVENNYWKNRIDPLYQIEAPKIFDELENFTRKFDAIIAHVTDKLIQISSGHALRTGVENPSALFVYRTSNLERGYVQENDRSFTNMDEFVGHCVDILWEKTDENLLNVQTVLNTDIREKLMKAFDDTTDYLNTLAHIETVRELLNAIARAKTNTQVKLAQVISWFKRNEVYDRQDYQADFPFYVALNMVTNTISNAASWDKATLNLNCDNKLMPGRTLDGMVYMFYGLLENAILRSGVDINELKVSIDLTFFDGVFMAKVINPISQSKSSETEVEKITSLKKSLTKEDYHRYAQSEGKSGLRKIWLTINSPRYQDPRLDFYQLENSFVVEISFRIEGI